MSPTLNKTTKNAEKCKKMKNTIIKFCIKEAWNTIFS